MKSRISIEIDFENQNKPVIQIARQSSDDVRDSLIQSFLEQRGSGSRWLTIQYKGESLEGKSLFHLVVVTPSELEEEIKLMKAALNELELKKS